MLLNQIIEPIQENGYMADDSDIYSRTWTDFTKRMKGSKVSQEDWTLFYNKYYGFIVGYIRNHSQFNDDQVQAVVDRVVNDIFVKHGLDKFETREGHPFRSWFASVIHNKISDYCEFIKKNNVFVSVKNIEDVENCSTAPDVNEESEKNQRDADKENISNDPDVYEKAEKDQWDAYIAYLVLDEVSKKSPPYQSQCFVWSTYYKKKPAQIALALNMKPEQVYEAIRSFKDKVVHAYKKMGESFDMQTFDWDELKQKADAAKAKYLKEADDFSRKVMQK